jgi:signal transduction histidine kinase
MSPEAAANSGTILVVDDDFVLRVMMRGELEHEGYTVVEAADGEEAFKLCGEQQFDLLIVDVVMPRMNGFELCQALRAQPSTAFVPILMATGLDDVASISKAYDVGATDFIAKPLTWIMLIHRVRYMLRAGRAFTAFRENQERLLKAIEAAENANRSKTDFLANMSHELRTPLNAIIGFSELIRERLYGPISDKYLEYIVHIGESGTHLLEIINDILEYSKAEVKRLVLSEEELDISTVVALAASVVEEMARKAEIDYRVTVADGMPPFIGDQVKLRQILINLLGNAVKFTPAGGSISLEAGRDADGSLYFLVRDTGIGIPADKMAIAMAPFGQIESGLARRNGGTGLGLPLSTALVELHGGKLVLTSEVGKGTEARASFPASRFVTPIAALVPAPAQVHAAA